MGATVEGEIGHVGQANAENPDKEKWYTTPEEAAGFVHATGVDALAVSIGTAHGAYRTAPRLDIERLGRFGRQWTCRWYCMEGRGFRIRTSGIPSRKVLQR